MFEKPTSELEKAYRMKPKKGVIAEHLGDAIWKNNLRQKCFLQNILKQRNLYWIRQTKQRLKKSCMSWKVAW